MSDETKKSDEATVLIDYTFHLSIRNSEITVQAENTEQALQIFKELTLQKAGLKHGDYKIINS